MEKEVRIDKWLWAARIFKTRSLAAESCKKGRIKMNGSTLKPSRTVKEGNIIDIKKGPVTYSFKILTATEKRVGAKIVGDIRENVTRPDQLELLEMTKLTGYTGREKGAGRPTKKDRRDLDDFFDDFDF